MSVKVGVPDKPQNNSIGRRLFGIAAPIIGGIYGGPAGAAAGSALAAKVNGESTQGALASGLKTGISEGMSGGGKGAGGGESTSKLDFGPGLKMPELGESAMGRRASMMSQNPQVAISEGLNSLSTLPQDHPFRKQYTEPLVRAQYMASRRA